MSTPTSFKRFKGKGTINIVSLLVVGIAIVAFANYGSSSKVTTASHADPINNYSASCPGPNYPTIQYGSTNVCVKYLQSFFSDSGFKVPVTGVFDSTTRSAVVFYQTIAKLTNDGIVGPATWGSISKTQPQFPYTVNNPYVALCLPPRPILQLGATGNCVKFLQQIYKNAGFGVTVNGTYDTATWDAVAYWEGNKQFTPNGITGPQEWYALTNDSRVTTQVLGSGGTPAPAPATSTTIKTSPAPTSTSSTSTVAKTPTVSPSPTVATVSPACTSTCQTYLTSLALQAKITQSVKSNTYVSSCAAPRPTLQVGASGNCVKYLQQILHDSGFAVAVDGSFGPATNSGVVFYQANKKLTADGIVGSQTWNALTGNGQVNGQVLGNGTWTPASGSAGSGDAGTQSNKTPQVYNQAVVAYLTALNNRRLAGIAYWLNASSQGSNSVQLASNPAPPCDSLCVLLLGFHPVYINTNTRPGFN